MQTPKYSALVAESQPDSAVCMTPRMWRQLLTEPLLAPGSSVLVTGRAPLDAIELLVELAFDVQGFCEDPAAVFAGRRRCPRAELELWKPDLATACPAAQFELALSVEQSRHAGNLYGWEARYETAQLLSLLRPQARLMVLVRADAQRHDVSCWSRHFACFPGQFSMNLIGDRSRGWWSNWSGRRPRAAVDLWAVTFQVPASPLTLEEWESYVECGMWTDSRCCCHAAAVQHGLHPQRRAA